MSSAVRGLEARQLIDLFAVQGLDTMRQRLEFAIRILETFGLHHGEYLQGRFEKGALQDCVGKMRQILPQIQNGLKQGKRDYSDYPDSVRSFVVEACPTGIGREAYFKELARASYRILPFAQSILFNPQLDGGDIADAALLSDAFLHFNDWLEPDEEGAINKRDLPAVLRLCFNSGALRYREQEIRFADLLKLWGSEGDNKQKLDAFLGRLKACGPFYASFIQNWEAVKPVSFEELTPFKRRASFRDCVVYCSAEIVERNLRVSVSYSMGQWFCDEFYGDESIRSDLCYLTARFPLSFLYEMDLARSPFGRRPSAKLIRSLQLYFFLVRTYGVAQKNRGALFDMVVHRKEEGDLPGFEGRKWLEQEAAEDQAFAVAWRGMEQILGGRYERLKDPLCWPLFEIIWRAEMREECLQTLSRIVHEGFMTIAQVYQSVPIYFFLVRTYGVSPEKRPALLNMLMHRSADVPVELPGFEGWKLSNRAAVEENAGFHEAWRRMEAIFRRVSKKETVDAELFKDPFCWSMFALIWQDNQERMVSELYAGLAAIPSISLTVPIFFRFCAVNGKLLTVLKIGEFVKQYKYAVQKLAEKGIRVEQMEILFLDPPCKLTTFLQLFQHFSPRIEGFPPLSAGGSTREYLQDLRERLFKPSPSQR